MFFLPGEVGGGPYHLPAVFESTNSDAQVYVKFRQLGPLMLDNQVVELDDELLQRSSIWPWAQYMALDLYKTCRTARLGFVGQTSKVLRDSGRDFIKIYVGFTRNSLAMRRVLGPDVSYYSARGGPGPPVLVHH